MESEIKLSNPESLSVGWDDRFGNHSDWSKRRGMPEYQAIRGGGGGGD